MEVNTSTSEHCEYGSQHFHQWTLWIWKSTLPSSPCPAVITLLKLPAPWIPYMKSSCVHDRCYWYIRSGSWLSKHAGSDSPGLSRNLPKYHATSQSLQSSQNLQKKKKMGLGGGGNLQSVSDNWKDWWSPLWIYVLKHNILTFPVSVPCHIILTFPVSVPCHIILTFPVSVPCHIMKIPEGRQLACGNTRSEKNGAPKECP